jgi:hypothetical protein
MEEKLVNSLKQKYGNSYLVEVFEWLYYEVKNVFLVYHFEFKKDI